MLITHVLPWHLNTLSSTIWPSLQCPSLDTQVTLTQKNYICFLHKSEQMELPESDLNVAWLEVVQRCTRRQTWQREESQAWRELIFLKGECLIADTEIFTSIINLVALWNANSVSYYFATPPPSTPLLFLSSLSKTLFMAAAFLWGLWERRSREIISESCIVFCFSLNCAPLESFSSWCFPLYCEGKKRKLCKITYTCPFMGPLSEEHSLP